MDPEIIRRVEAVLFASGRFMDASRIAELVEASEKNVEHALQALRDNLVEYGSALQIVEEDGAWKLHVRDEYLEVVSAVVSDTELSGPVLETLAIIAWRSPILQSEVVDIRGSNAYEHVKELVERSFITKTPEGRSYRLAITEKFFDYFDVEGREDIRKVFKEVEEEHRIKEMELELEQKRLQEAIRKAEEGEAAEVDIPQGDELPIEQEKLPDKKVDIDKLDEVLDKSAKTRERVGSELKSMRETDVDNEDSEEEPDAKTSDTPEEPEDGPENEPEEDDLDVFEEESTDEDIDDPELAEAKRIREQAEKNMEDL